MKLRSQLRNGGCIVICLLLPVAIATAGGNGEDKSGAAEEPVTLTYWDEFPQPDVSSTWREIISEFNERHSGSIQVERRAIPDDEFFTALRTGVTGSNPPDVFQHESGFQLGQLVDAGAVMDITSWWEENKDRWQSGVNSGNTIEGRVYGVPFESLLRDLLAWNVDILDEHNLEPPETWAEFMEAAETLDAAGEVPLAIGNRDGWPGGHLWQTIALRIAGAEKQNRLIARDGVHWTDPDFIRATELYAQLSEYLNPGFQTDQFGEGQSFFLGGNAAFFHPFTLHMSGWPSRDEFNWEWSRFPQIPEHRNSGVSPQDMFAVHLYSWSISSNTDHPEAAQTFLEYLTSVETQKQYVDNRRLTPMKGVLEEDEVDPDLERWQQVLSNSTGTIGFVVLEIPAEVSRRVFDNGALAVWTGDMTPEEWMWEMEQAHAELTDTEAVRNP